MRDYVDFNNLNGELRILSGIDIVILCMKFYFFFIFVYLYVFELLLGGLFWVIVKYEGFYLL